MMTRKTTDKTQEELLGEIENLRLRLEDAEETLRAIGNGEVDAFVVSGAGGEQIFTLKGAEHPYRVLVETMNEGAATLGADGTILYCNNRLAALLQIPLERVIGTRFESYVVPADKSLITARLNRCGTECDKDETALITSNGNLIPVLISCCHSGLFNDQGISMVVTDLSQQKRNEEFIASEKLARSIIEQAGEVIIVCNQAGHVINASRLAHQLCDGNPLLRPFDETFRLHKAGTGEPISVSELFAGVTSRNIEVTLDQGGKSKFYLILNSTLLHGAEKALLGCVVTLTDITERKRAEEALKESESMFRSLFESSLDAVFLTIPDGRVLAANPAACFMFGMSEEEIIRVGLAGLIDPNDPKHTAAIEQRKKTGRFSGIELDYIRKNGQRFPAEVDSVVLAGEPQRSFVIIRDITARKQVEKQIKTSLAEKEVLLKEIHHRVKNNLQVISSLVSLQTDSLADDRIRDELNDVRDRVRSMALIHEKLYQTSDLAQLNFADYATSLLHSLWRSHGSLAGKARLNLAVAPVALPIEAAVPCGLILNELAGNALKHAFPNNSSGEVTVSLTHDSTTETVCLRIHDDGVGLPAGFDWRQSRSLGLRLVQILTGQLRGTVEMETGSGSEFRVTFPLNRFQK